MTKKQQTQGDRNDDHQQIKKEFCSAERHAGLLRDDVYRPIRGIQYEIGPHHHEYTQRCEYHGQDGDQQLLPEQFHRQTIETDGQAIEIDNPTEYQGHSHLGDHTPAKRAQQAQFDDDQNDEEDRSHLPQGDG
ncbi:hypothetical protein BMONG18_1608 [Bifidobacterium mongoliense]|uniref:Uncharacterized protein n=1 Tax=Bifidobacterium mongoliense TaxID=518643 RepID=A0A423UC81_9BIFI|nr:hypothetical protein [Bifidobacterium mongoliense]ROT86288.1 hypothetical protein BMONG18_1608 [Bifidobacterium mongoliense]